MKKIVLITSFICLSILCNAQIIDLTVRDTTRQQQNFLSEVTVGKEKYLTFNLIATPQDVLSEKLTRDKEATARYGEKASRGIFLIEMKPECKMLTLDDIFKEYNITNNNRHLKIYVDSIKAMHPLTILAVKSAISSVRIVRSLKYKTDVINITKINARKGFEPVSAEKLQ